MRLGDILEIIGAAALTVVAYLVWGLPAGLAGVGVTLVYEGQCLGHISLPSIMQVLGETRYRRVMALEGQLGEWPANRPARGTSKAALQAEAKWLEESILFQRKLDLDVSGLLTELERAREALRRYDEPQS
jgi:hypothetical protein